MVFALNMKLKNAFDGIGAEFHPWHRDLLFKSDTELFTSCSKRISHLKVVSVNFFFNVHEGPWKSP